MDLSVKTRTKMGKAVKALRKEGLIPAELYGHGLANAHLSVSAKEFLKIFKVAGTSTILTLVTEKEKRPAIIHGVVRDAVTDEVAHIDFYQVRMDEKITAKVPLEFKGEAPAVKTKGAIINKSMTEIEVEALPNDLPHNLTVDISSLDDLNKSIYVKDIKTPRGVVILIDGETAVVTATPPAAEEVVEAPAVDVADVKVETEEKKAERAAEKADKGEKTGDKPAAK
ncbi:MAG TPA: 50S ribosomal protein L25 [Candidatus Paceibacterota bacterium]|jgi:large subunit ribosomal protein L25|nr:50S ribosomal protein L25 [Candidatus Paceibacterota bacterium]